MSDAAMGEGPGRPARTEAVTRGVCRLFASLGFAPLREAVLPNGRRVDVAGLSADGQIVVAEVKSSLEDFRTDRKWVAYLEFCDRFFFAVDGEFPTDLVPEDVGLIVADAFGGAIRREAPDARLHPSRRKALTLRFARVAMDRLARQYDPDLVAF